MKLRNSLLSGFAALALASVGAHAQEIDTYSGSSGPGFNEGYNDGDLVLSFYSASDTSNGGPGDLLFNLGSASSFTGLAAGTYSVAGFNGSSTSGQPAVGFGSTELTSYPAGSLTAPSSSSFWTVMGSNQTSNELWLTGTTAQARASSSTQSTLAGIIGAIGSAGANNANSDGSAFDSSQGTFSNINSQNKWANFPAVAANSISSTSDQLGLYQLLPGTGSGGSATELGYFTLTDNAGSFSLSFTAIPEPSTYAAILGALTVGFVLVRRRFGATRLNALA
jgi:hypothetical protein